MIGRQISHFYIIRTLGSGGMGVVYEAQDTRLPRSVAIKVLKPALAKDVDAIRRFKREARLAASLNHPNICTILDIDEGHGSGLHRHGAASRQEPEGTLAAGPLPLDRSLDVASQVADALAAAHDHGIVHRDLTPGNIFLTSNGLVKLLDFGLAKHFATFEGDEPTVGRPHVHRRSRRHDALHGARTAVRCRHGRLSQRFVFIRRRPLSDGQRRPAVRSARRRTR